MNLAKKSAIAVVAGLAVFATLGEASSSGDANSAGSSAAVESAAAGESAASGDMSTDMGADETAAAAEARSDAWYTDEFGSFEAFTEKGRGDGVVKLPAGAEVGLVTASHKGDSNFAISALDDGNQSTGDLLVNTIGNYKGVTAFGLSSLGNPAAKFQVTADGPWTITVEPLSSAPALTIPAKGKGDAVFRYDGPAADWNVTHKGDSNFVLWQNGTDWMPNLAVNEIGNYKGTVPMSGGPSIVAVSADGAWSIS